MFYGFSLDDIEKSANVIVWDNKKKHFVLDDEDFKDCILNIDTFSPELMNFIFEQVGAQAKEANRVEVPFDKIAPYKEDFWNASSEEGLKVPIGISEKGETQFLELDHKDLVHVLVAGNTGKGKTNLLHVIINSLCLIYSPWELELYLIDYKMVGFAKYAAHRLPHARVVANKTDKEFGLSVLKRVKDEIKQRAEKFGVDETIADYRKKKPDDIIPRILLIIDEFQDIFKDENTEANASIILDDIIKKGRGFGIHVLLASQTLAGAFNIPESTSDQIAVRIALFCSESDSRRILAGNNTAANKLSRIGEAIYNNNNGSKENNIRFQVALKSDKMEENLQYLFDQAQELEYHPPYPQIVFDGEKLPDIRNNRMLNDLLITFPSIPTLIDVPVWLGTPLDIKGPTTAYFKRNGGNNLIIVGQNDTAASAMFLSIIISLASQYDQKKVHFCFVDLSSSNIFSILSDIMPHPVKLVESDDLPDLIEKIYEKVNERKGKGRKNTFSSIYFIIFGLQQAWILNEKDRNAYSSEGEPQISTIDQLTTILKDGPFVDVHTLVWCDNYQNLDRRIGEQLLEEFSMRVALQMGTDESGRLINSLEASKLGSFKAIYFSKQDNYFEKFQPYGLPTEDWLSWVKERFCSKGINGNKLLNK